MESIQRLERTQQLYTTQTETCQDQVDQCFDLTPWEVGFIGICGKKYPLKIGSCKVGRDHRTCQIVLDLKPISKQHAVIIINEKECLLMDLESANKTKINGKPLQPFISYPLNNGDIIHFGNVIGVFRLLEEENDLPMTQALDIIPETPSISRHASKLKIHTTIPETPDVSDKEESLIIASQQNQDIFKSLISNSMKKKSAVTITQPVASIKIDNKFCISPNKSTSFNSMNNPPVSINKNNKTAAEKSNDLNIHTLDTHMPGNVSSSVYSLDTQLPSPLDEHLPYMGKVCGGSEENSQTLAVEKDSTTVHYKDQTSPNRGTSNHKEVDKHDESNNSILFDDFDSFSQPDDNECGSQTLLQPEIRPLKIIEYVPNAGQLEIINENKSSTGTVKRNIRFESAGSSDGEDIIPLTQRVPKKTVYDNDLTDCEDDNIENAIKRSLKSNYVSTSMKPDDVLCKVATQIIKNDNIVGVGSVNSNEEAVTEIYPNTHSPDASFGSLVISTKNVKRKEMANNSIENKTTKITLNADDCDDDRTNDFIKISHNKVNFTSLTENANIDVEYSVTQVVKGNPLGNNSVNATDNRVQNISIKHSPSQILNNNTPSQSQERFPFKIPLVSPNKKCTGKTPEITIEDEECYYAATQDLLNDLCTQKETSIETETSVDVTEIIKNQSDSSDAEATPKKVIARVMHTELPDSQEIKSCVKKKTRCFLFESSSDSDSEVNTEDQHTTVVFKRNKSRANDDKLNSNKHFDIESLPTRAGTRLRRPTDKLKNTKGITKKISPNILKSKFLAHQEDDIDKDIINENLSRLKNKRVAKVDIRNTNENKSKSDRSNNELKPKVQDKSTKNVTDLIDVVKSTRKKRETHKQDQDTKSTEKKSNGNGQIKDELSTAKRQGIRNNNSTERKSLDREQLTIRKESRDIKKTNDKKRSRDMIIINKKEGSRETKLTSSDKNLTPKAGELKQKRGEEYLDGVSNDYVRKLRSCRLKHGSEGNVKNSETIESKKNDRNKQNNRKSKKEPSPFIEKEIRRSKRQKMDTKEESMQKVVTQISVKKTNHEKNIEYTVPSGYNVDSPKNIKRHASSDISVSSPKKKRFTLEGTVNSSVPRRLSVDRRRKIEHVLFSSCYDQKVMDAFENLGAFVVKDVMKCTVVVTSKIRRTFTLLCAMGLGLPIVGQKWLEACKINKMIVDPWLYLIKDKEAEERYDFDLRVTLLGKRNFLNGFNISCTPSVKPKSDHLKLIVECSGGSWKEGGNNWICVSCFDDKWLWSSLEIRGATIVSSEFILQGAFKQQALVMENKFQETA